MNMFLPVNRLTSSIHAIYRPLARFRRGEPSASSHRTAKSPDLPSVSDSEDTPRTDDSLPSDEDTEGDFDHSVGGVITDHSHAGRVSPETIPDLDSSVPDVSSMRDRTTSRAGSMVTVKPNRRAQLAGKLRDVFELEDIHEVVAGKVDVFTVQVTLLTCPTRRNAVLVASLGL